MAETTAADLHGRIALVTGASSGLGLETARELAGRGARVLLACRDRERAQAAREQLAVTARGPLEILSLDLADLAGVAAAAQRVRQQCDRLDLLINNAGIMAIPRRLSVDGFELQFATNHLGHFALTRALLPLLIQTPASRVVTVTSGIQQLGRIAFDDLQGERRYDPWRAYAQSKLANTMFALELQERLRQQGADTLSLAAHPGIARTNLQAASVAASGGRGAAFALRWLAPLWPSAAQGARPQLQAATAPGLQGGELLAPGGPAELWGDPGPGRLPAAARNSSDRARLWQISETLCGWG